MLVAPCRSTRSSRCCSTRVVSIEVAGSGEATQALLLRNLWEHSPQWCHKLACSAFQPFSISTVLHYGHCNFATCSPRVRALTQAASAGCLSGAGSCASVVPISPSSCSPCSRVGSCHIHAVIPLGGQVSRPHICKLPQILIPLHAVCYPSQPFFSAILGAVYIAELHIRLPHASPLLQPQSDQ